MDLKDPRWMYVKAAMFVLIGCICFGLILLGRPSISTATLLMLMIWAFCRAYYFAFYVIGRYVDPQYRFSGLLSFLRYLLGRRKQ